MARSGAATLLVVCVLAAMGTFAASFVGGAPGLRGASQRTPSVAMNFFDPNYTPPTTYNTTPPPSAGGITVADPNTYIIGITALMIVSVFANSKGFFAPW
jgi:hypothetical protein